MNALDCSFTSMDSADTSPLAPVFSPITPLHTTASPSADTPVGFSTSQQPGPSRQHSLSPALYSDVSLRSECIPGNPISCSSLHITRKWSGFKVVIDNIDMCLKPRHQTFERRTRSIHYVNVYAVRDHIDLSNCSQLTTGREVSITSLLPSDNDRKRIIENFSVLAGRILCNCIYTSLSGDTRSGDQTHLA